MILSLLLTLAFVSNAAAATAPGWYFKPNSEHKQPEVYGGETFIDKYG